MKFLLSFLFVLVLFVSHIKGQTDFNMELQSHIDWQEQGSGCWGHTDSKGIEYAIIGTRKAIRVLSLEDPKNPISRLVIPGATNTWREARAYGDFIYVTTEGPDGVTIIDISKGPDNFTWKRWKPAIALANNDTMRTVHSINLDAQGFLYLNGHNIDPRGVLIFDLKKDGYNPELVANVGTLYTHDCYATDSILYTADLGSGVGVYDIKDKANPKFLNRFNTSSVFAHNMWTSPDEKYLYTTDERSGAYVDVYDVRDPKNIKFISKYRNEDSKLGRVIPHNVYTTSTNHAVTSWYTDGVLIKDMSRPDNVVKVGSFDTYFNESSLPATGAWFEGCWGVYPFLKSGTIVASDINTGLWIFKPTYTRACYLEGNTLAKDENGKIFPIIGAKVSIKAIRSAFDDSDQNGVYKTGIAEAGKYKVFFSHPDFPSDSIELDLKNGEVVNHDFIFTANFLKVNIKDKSNKPISVAKAFIFNDSSNNAGSADDNGLVKFPVKLGNKYKIQVAAWGYKGQEIDVETQSSIDVTLEDGYEDDFFVDLGWNNTIKTTAGNWERAIPKGTKQGQDIINADEDATDDIGKHAFVTGNGGNSAGENDVDNGETALESPLMDFSKNDSITLSYERWFVNTGGDGMPNDEMEILLSNGKDIITLEKINASFSTWIPVSIGINRNKFDFTKEMKLIVKIADKPVGHLVEGGLDAFKVEQLNIISGTKEENLVTLSVSPNPATNTLTVEGLKSLNNISIYGLDGKKILETTAPIINVGSLSNGMYIGVATSNNGLQKAFKFAISK
jgi:choice-of-anchor B domain-containing protein